MLAGQSCLILQGGIMKREEIIKQLSRMKDEKRKFQSKIVELQSQIIEMNNYIVKIESILNIKEKDYDNKKMR